MGTVNQEQYKGCDVINPPHAEEQNMSWGDLAKWVLSEHLKLGTPGF